jgi:hypothetical protein
MVYLLMLLCFHGNAESIGNSPGVTSYKPAADPIAALFFGSCPGNVSTDYKNGCFKIPASEWRAASWPAKATCPSCQNSSDANCAACLPLRKQVPNCIVIHHSGVKKDSYKKNPIAAMQDLYKYSTTGLEDGLKSKLWGDVPYHFIIDPDGNLIEGRSAEYAPDSNTGIDTCGKINVVIEGSFSDLTDEKKYLMGSNNKYQTGPDGNYIPNPNFGQKTGDADTFSPAQEKVVRATVAALQSKYGKGIPIVAHQDLPGSNGTDCPGQGVKKALAAVFRGTCPTKGQCSP